MKNLLQILILINLLGSLGCMKDLPPCTKPTIEIKATDVDGKCLNDCQVRFSVQAKLDDKVIALKESELKYKWTFVENGVPKDSFNKTLTLRFTEVGIYTIKVKVWDESKTVYCKDMEVTYKHPALRKSFADFDFEPGDTVYYLDPCPEALKIKIIDKSENAEYRKWTFSNGKGPTIPFMNPENLYFPSHIFSSPDTVYVTLEISKNVAPKTKKIYLKPYQYESGELDFESIGLEEPIFITPKDTFFIFHYFPIQDGVSKSYTAAASDRAFSRPPYYADLYSNRGTPSSTKMYNVKPFIPYTSLTPGVYYNVLNLKRGDLEQIKTSAIALMQLNNTPYEPENNNLTPPRTNPPLNIRLDTIHEERGMFFEAKGLLELNRNRDIIIYGVLKELRINEELKKGGFLITGKVNLAGSILSNKEKFIFPKESTKLVEIRQLCIEGNECWGFGVKNENGIEKTCIFKIDIDKNMLIGELNETPLPVNFEVIKMLMQNGNITLIGNENNNGVIYRYGGRMTQEQNFVFRDVRFTPDNNYIICIGAHQRRAASIVVNLKNLNPIGNMTYYTNAIPNAITSMATCINPINANNLYCGFVIAGYSVKSATKQNTFYVRTDAWGRIN